MSGIQTGQRLLRRKSVYNNPVHFEEPDLTQLAAVIWSFSKILLISYILKHQNVQAYKDWKRKGALTSLSSHLIEKKQPRGVGFGHTFYPVSMYSYCDLSTFSCLSHPL